MIADQFFLRVMKATEYKNDKKWNFLINLYPYNTVYFVLDGDGYVRIEDVVTRLLPGHAYLIPANTLYSCWCETSIHKLYVEFYLERAPGEDVFLGNSGSILEAAFPLRDTRALCACQGQETMRQQLMFQGLLLRALSPFAEIGDGNTRPAKDLVRFKPILADILHNLGGDLRLTEVAQRNGWNPSTLSREFREAFGCTMKTYTARLLVNTLRQDLLFSTKTLTQLATEYHFCDAYYLSAYFKRYIGMSPDLYRKSRTGALPGRESSEPFVRIGE